MTAATITAASAGADLLDELRQLVNRHDGAASAEEIHQICDEAAKLVGRARRRLARLVRQAEPEPEPAERKPEPATEPQRTAATPPAPAREAERPAPSPAVAPARPTAAAQPPASRAATIEIRPDRPLSRPAPQPTKQRRIAVIITMLGCLWSMLRHGTARTVQRVGRAVKSFVRRTAASARSRPQRTVEADDHPTECIVCGPGCCSPILGVHGTRAGPLVGRTVVSVQ